MGISSGPILIMCLPSMLKNRYGLLELDIETGKRIPKKSAYWFRDILSKKQLDD